jgi:hypothetical protein
MATPKKISQLTAVVTPAGTDTLAAVQGSTTKKLTVTQLLTLAGNPAFELKTDAYVLVAGDRISIEVAVAKTVTVAATIAAGDEFIVHNSTASTGVVSIEPNTGHTIRGAAGNVVGGTDTLTIPAGSTVRLLAVSSALLEII